MRKHIIRLMAYGLRLTFCLLLLVSVASAQGVGKVADSLHAVILQKVENGDSSVSGSLNAMLQCYEQNYGSASAEYGDCLMWSARICCQMNDQKQARHLLKMANKCFANHGRGLFDGRDTLHELMRLDLLSDIEYYDGRQRLALRYARQSFELKKIFFGQDHEVCLQAMLDLSRLYAEMLRQRKSNLMHNAGYDAYKTLIRQQFCQRSESERTTYWNSAIRYIGTTLELACKASGKNSLRRNAELAGSAYNALLLSKGLLLNTTVSFNNFVLSSNCDEAVALLNQRKEHIDAGASQGSVDTLDYAILDALKQAGQEFNLPILGITWHDVQQRLRDDDLVVEFYKTQSGEYAAILLKRQWKAPRLVRLENSFKTDVKAGIFRYKHVSLHEALLAADFENNTEANAEMLWRISRAVWCDAIVKHFPGADGGKTRGRILFSADGQLQVTAIESLPFNEPVAQGDGRASYSCISDVYDVYRLSSSRELVLMDSISSLDSAVIFGGLFYDTELDPVEYQSGVQSTQRAAMSSIAFLPGSQMEAKAIHSILHSTPGAPTDRTLLGSSGVEEEFKALSEKQYSILHMATHGFFFDKNDSLVQSKYDLGKNPLSYSGLLMAGAEAKWQGWDVPAGRDDGLLTALEISNVDLRGLDMVVLSACETAKGSITADGVFGLQRGFKMAGARSILMSLWKVDDEATSLLMTEFYRNWITKGKSKYEALHLAKQSVRSHTEKGWDSPKYWAAFILLDAL